MITLDEAFAKFKSRLELTDNEQKDVSKRHNELRELIRNSINLERDFLSGSYKRWTKTRPLKDVDVVCVLDAEKEKEYLNKESNKLLEKFRDILIPTYGKDYVSIGRRSVSVSFGLKESETEEHVLSIDVVPAFTEKKYYKIPDPKTKEGWTKTDPEIHAEKTTEANKKFSEQWKPLVKMIKKWNETQGKPIKPSFLIEVMALDILFPPFSGGYQYELKSFFWTAKTRLREEWRDPAGLGPAVSDDMDESKYRIAEEKLIEAGKNVEYAMLLSKQGRNGESLKVWREKIFGDMFPLS